jgi:GH24 family phage-related lysozyme (muramidase)
MAIANPMPQVDASLLANAYTKFDLPNLGQLFNQAQAQKAQQEYLQVQGDQLKAQQPGIIADTLKRTQEYMANTAYSIQSSPPDQQEGLYNQARAQLLQTGLVKPEEMPNYMEGGKDLVTQYAKMSPIAAEAQKAALDNQIKMTDLGIKGQELEIKKMEAQGGGKDAKKDYFNMATKLQSDFTNQSKEFATVQTAKKRIDASVTDPSAAGDLSLIFNYMKILDPGSTVREGEFATAQNSAGIPDIIRARYNQLISGERLAAPQRADFLDRATKLYDAQEKQHFQIVDDFTQKAERYGINPNDVIVDYTGKFKDRKAMQAVDMSGYEQAAKDHPGLKEDQYRQLMSRKAKAVGAQAQAGIQDTRQYEGLTLTPYKDGNGVSVGYGHYMNKPTSKQQFAAIGADHEAVKSGREALTKEQADQLYQMDVQTAANDARQLVANFDKQPPAVQKALVDMAYNLGATKLEQFRPTLNAIQAGNYKAAADRLGRTKWNDQVGQRAQDIRLALRNA